MVFDSLSLGDLPQDIERATGVRLRDQSVRLATYSARLQLFLTSNFALAAEYRQKPDEYRPIGSLVKAEADWLTFDAAYVINNHLTVAARLRTFRRRLEPHRQRRVALRTNLNLNPIVCPSPTFP